MQLDKRILMVDDSAALRAMLGEMLDALGIEYIEAENGEEALAKLESEGPFDIALVDLHMPKMDGLEFVERVRADSTWDGLSIAMVTSESTVGRVADALEAGADEFLMKPFNREMLVAKLNVLDLHGSDN